MGVLERGPAPSGWFTSTKGARDGFDQEKRSKQGTFRSVHRIGFEFIHNHKPVSGPCPAGATNARLERFAARPQSERHSRESFRPHTARSIQSIDQFQLIYWDPHPAQKSMHTRSRTETGSLHSIRRSIGRSIEPPSRPPSRPTLSRGTMDPHIPPTGPAEAAADRGATIVTITGK